MVNTSKKFWNQKHDDYLTRDWIDRPSIFATQVIKYFPKDSYILDLGSGQGQDSRYFSKNNFSVLSTDFSERALDISKYKAKRDSQKMKFKKVDISLKLPFASNSFDVVYSHMALHYWDFDKTDEIFSEIYRILKPQGVFACLLNSDKDAEIKDFKKIGKNLYFDPAGLNKSYFSAKLLQKYISGKYDFVLLDDKGESHKDKLKSLTRFVGIKK